MSWITESAQTFKALFTAEHAPVAPQFDPITLNQVLPASILLFYGFPGTIPTQRLGVNKYHYPYHPPFHAALMMYDGVFHNVGKFRTDELILDQFKSTRRIDVISYSMTPEQRSKIMVATELDTSVPHTGLELTDYGIGTFLNFGFSFIRHGKQPICSEDVVSLLGLAGVKSSSLDPKETAPWDIATYAEDHKTECDRRTLWVGTDYHQ